MYKCLFYGDKVYLSSGLSERGVVMWIEYKHVNINYENILFFHGIIGKYFVFNKAREKEAEENTELEFI